MLCKKSNNRKKNPGFSEIDGKKKDSVSKLVDQLDASKKKDKRNELHPPSAASSNLTPSLTNEDKNRPPSIYY